MYNWMQNWLSQLAATSQMVYLQGKIIRETVKVEKKRWIRIVF